MDFHLCIRVIIETLSLFQPIKLVSMIIIPFASAFLNVHINNLLQKEVKDIPTCLVFKLCQDYVSWILQQRLYSSDIQILSNELITRLNIAKIYCGAPIPGINLKQHQDLIDDTSKLRDFLSLLPIFWSSIVNFSVSIYMMDIKSVYPVRFMFSVLCITMCGILTYFTDASLYENTKPSSGIVTKLTDHNNVHTKMSLGCHIDINFEANKQKMKNQQRNIQTYVIIFINMIMTYISLSSNNIAQLMAFGNISWMIGCLADNIKSIYYYTYMQDFISLCKCMEYHRLQTGNEILTDFDSVSFKNASFGYYSDDLRKMPKIKEIIKNFSYTFFKGNLYYIEAENGIGKSTIMRMFISNLIKGDVLFGITNRKKLTFEIIRKLIFLLVQASEYMPKLTKNEISDFKGKDKWLINQLLLEDLFEKDMVEMSGGQKKRMLIYLVLTSDAPIILLDEIFSELSTEETPEIPEGGGWLSRAIHTITHWEGRHNKIIIIVGHGLLDLIPNNQDIIKLRLENYNDNTVLTSR
jgi:ABC-type cobalamin/Fe3+-siderophores transport system ATPase subunit